MNGAQNLLRKTVDSTTNIGAAALVSVMFIVVANVVYRAFGGVIPGTYDLVEIIIVLVAGFSIANTEIHGRQTNVDMLILHLPDRTKLRLRNVCNFLSLVYWAIIAWMTCVVTLENAERGEVTDTLQVSVIPFRFIWSFSLILICLVILYNVQQTRKQLQEMNG
jgi:TRAP-type C4-dicarboxylate transport system permease small subunit